MHPRPPLCDGFVRGQESLVALARTEPWFIIHTASMRYVLVRLYEMHPRPREWPRGGGPQKVREDPLALRGPMSTQRHGQRRLSCKAIGRLQRCHNAAYGTILVPVAKGSSESLLRCSCLAARRLGAIGD